MRRASGYSLRIADDRYFWDYYGPPPKLDRVETRLFPEGGLYYGMTGFRAPLNADPLRMKSRYEFRTIYLLDGGYAASIYEFADGSADVSIGAGFTCFSQTGDSTLSFSIRVNRVDYPALERKIAAVLGAVRRHPDYIPHMNTPKGYQITNRRGKRWFEPALAAA